MKEHYLHKMTNAYLMCKCGKKFFDSKTKPASMKIDEHIVKEREGSNG